MVKAQRSEARKQQTKKLSKGSLSNNSKKQQTKRTLKNDKPQTEVDLSTNNIAKELCPGRVFRTRQSNLNEIPAQGLQTKQRKCMLR